MHFSKGTLRAVLPLGLALASVSDAFTVIAPPAESVVVSPHQTAQPAFISTTSNLPSQRALLEQAVGSFSTINVAATASAPVATAPAVTTNAATSAGVTITGLNYDGKVPTTEADEYVVISNGTKNPIDVSGYYLYVATTGTQGPTFTFPKGSTIQAGKSVRIYTNEIHKETGGYSYASGKALWNNRGGLAVLKDAKGLKLSEFKYKPSQA